MFVLFPASTSSKGQNFDSVLFLIPEHRAGIELQRVIDSSM